ncbi:A/G-specific adenine glycosylase [Dongia deserti]|uniref:A/G-specific adenine glycosylase n=1 Tax=Dongia deserti TaxID=2268030 RepID=UPI002548FBA2|nr:A/G-specific adenine glycosylase [Dongia deserti]
MPQKLLAWYDRHRRSLPWRARPGVTADPYHVWLSEIMLQQTTVPAVKPYYETFLKRWPTVEELARADIHDVMAAWAGLGYYARARNLHKCAVIVTERHGGRFPDGEDALRELPGIGRYTAGAIAAIAFDRHATILDGNVERVVSRIHRLQTPLPKAKVELWALAEQLTPKERPGDYAQAIMDLGATICTPQKPACSLCPWRGDCAAFAAGDQETYPRKAPKAERPRRYGAAFWIVNERGEVALRRRPPSGLLGGMLEPPGTAWADQPLGKTAALRKAPLSAEWRWCDGMVRHVFTHFALELQVACAWVAGRPLKDTEWVAIDQLGAVALPSVMRKVAKLALASAVQNKRAAQ